MKQPITYIKRRRFQSSYVTPLQHKLLKYNEMIKIKPVAPNSFGYTVDTLQKKERQYSLIFWRTSILIY